MFGSSTSVCWLRSTFSRRQLRRPRHCQLSISTRYIGWQICVTRVLNEKQVKGSWQICTRDQLWPGRKWCPLEFLLSQYWQQCAPASWPHVSLFFHCAAVRQSEAECGRQAASGELHRCGCYPTSSKPVPSHNQNVSTLQQKDSVCVYCTFRDGPRHCCAKSLQGEAPCGSAMYGKVGEMSPAPSTPSPSPTPLPLSQPLPPAWTPSWGRQGGQGRINGITGKGLRTAVALSNASCFLFVVRKMSFRVWSQTISMLLIEQDKRGAMGRTKHNRHGPSHDQPSVLSWRL